MKKLHLVCNAHLDPVWLWEIEEGIAETLSTFRVAADFCENYDGFVFNHNEAILYQWVEEHDEELFKRIQKLVKEKKWNIMGGWYLQPDCNMPSGESFVRQILEGKYYFRDKFKIEPTTAVNFDAFGHTRGLVEILKKTNYDSYIFCRPEPDMLDLPADDFLWIGYQGDQLLCHRAYNSYESHRGEADKKIEGFIETHKDKETGIVLWGIGNHGGGPSRIDYEKIKELNERVDFEIIHSTPENYFDDVLREKEVLPKYEGILNPRYIGCYTTQIRIKQLHRKLENELYKTEKMVAHATLQGYFRYPKSAIDSAIRDLLLMEFHDILPGSSIPEVEDYAISLAGHGLEELKRLKTKAFFALCSGMEVAKEGTIPVIAYNPHPYPVTGMFECEFQLPDQNKNKLLFANPVVYQNGEKVPCQAEWESSNFNVDWRKRSVFEATLLPSQINRFDVKIELIDAKTSSNEISNNDDFEFVTNDMKVVINTKTGTIDKYEVKGTDYIKGKAFLPLVIQDDDNSWAHKEKGFRNVIGSFELMNKKEAQEFCGLHSDDISSVRIIEDGEVRTVVEAIMKYNHSFLVNRYYLPKKGTEVKVTTRVFWNEKMKMLKLSIPTTFKSGGYLGQTAYGVEELLTNGDEMVSQKWNLAYDGNSAVSIINTGIYGSDYADGEIRLSLLRSPGYSAGKSDFSVRRKYILPQDRFSRFIDQGEREYEFYLNASSYEERRKLVDRESMIKNETPMILSFFPTGAGQKSGCFARLNDDVIQMTTFKREERGSCYIIRLFNPTDSHVTSTLLIDALEFQETFEFEPYEILSVKVDPKKKRMKVVNLMEMTTFDKPIYM
ncbi:MAG: alpha-mannosidase [Clostridia bacterium]|nr:alpha-mannosidase [Clostridia bacterium]